MLRRLHCTRFIALAGLKSRRHRARSRHCANAIVGPGQVADLLALPARWRSAFGVVVESHNVQSLPPELHATASAAVASLVAAGGTLLVLAAAGDGTAKGPPWPLAREEIEAFAVDDLTIVSADLVAIDVPRWRAVFER